MSKADIPENVNFQGGERGRYAQRYAGGTNVVVLDPDVAASFSTSDQVNRVLRSVIEASAVIGLSQRPTSTRRRPARAAKAKRA